MFSSIRYRYSSVLFYEIQIVKCSLLSDTDSQQFSTTIYRFLELLRCPPDVGCPFIAVHGNLVEYGLFRQCCPHEFGCINRMLVVLSGLSTGCWFSVNRLFGCVNKMLVLLTGCWLFIQSCQQDVGCKTGCWFL